MSVMISKAKRKKLKSMDDEQAMRYLVPKPVQKAAKQVPTEGGQKGMLDVLEKAGKTESKLK